MRIKLKNKTFNIVWRSKPMKKTFSPAPHPTADALPPQAACPVAARDEGSTHPDELPKALEPAAAPADELRQTPEPSAACAPPCPPTAPVWHSFTDRRCAVLERLGYPDEYPRVFRPSVIELAGIITEVELMDSYYLIEICGEQLPAGLVAEVFGELTPDHIVRVLDYYRKSTVEVKRKRQYLRSMLYNSVMELEADTLREVWQDTFTFEETRSGTDD